MCVWWLGLNIQCRTGRNWLLTLTFLHLIKVVKRTSYEAALTLQFFNSCLDTRSCGNSILCMYFVNNLFFDNNCVQLFRFTYCMCKSELNKPKTVPIVPSLKTMENIPNILYYLIYLSNPQFFTLWQRLLESIPVDTAWKTGIYPGKVSSPSHGTHTWTELDGEAEGTCKLHT